MLMKKGFSLEAFLHIKANTKTAQEEEMHVDDIDLVETDENGVPLSQGERNRDYLIQNAVDSVPTDRELPEWAQTNNGSPAEQLPDRQIQIQDNLAMFLPQGPDGEAQAAALADLVSDKIAQYGEPYNDVFWAVVGHGDLQGQVDFNTALHVADQASFANQSQAVAKLVSEGADPMDALASTMFAGNKEPFTI